MNEKRFARYCVIAFLCVIAASAYPMYMGAKVIIETMRFGAVPVESYPKYIIPYTPIAIALTFGTALMPVFSRYGRPRAYLYGCACSLPVFFISEYIFEKKVMVSTTQAVPLESWQMSLCYVPPEQYETRTWEAVDVLLGGYSPMFKLHFYLISVVLIVSLLGCVYGYADMIRSGSGRGKVLAAGYALDYFNIVLA